MSERRLEQVQGMRAFARRFFALDISDEESSGVLELLETGEFASLDLPRLIERLRVRH